MAPFSQYWLSWSNGYDICLPNFKMLAEDPSSILGGSTQAPGKFPGPLFLLFFFMRRRIRPDLLPSKFEIRWSVRSALSQDDGREEKEL